MVLSQEATLSLVQKWVSQRSDLPEGCTVSTTEERRRKVPHHKVRWVHPEYGMDFLLYIVYVSSDEEVVIEVDRMEFFSRATADGFAGFKAESRFFQIHADATTRPTWFLSVERTHHSLDMRGIDAFCKIQLHPTGTLKVPVQIKTSRTGVRHFHKSYPQYRDIVPCIFAPLSETEDMIRQRTFSALGGIRRKINRGLVSLEEYKRMTTKALRSRQGSKPTAQNGAAT